MKKTVKRTVPAIMAAVMLMQTNLFAASAYFGDVTSRYEWAREAIDTLCEKGVISGYKDGYYRPAYPIKRCDFTVMLFGRFGDEGVYDTSLPEDIDSGIYYENAYKWAAAQGLFVSGQPFYPQEYITRQDAFYCLFRCLEAEGYVTDNNKTSKLSAFLDGADVDADKKEALATLASLGIISGTNGLLFPKNTLTRAEMAVIFYKADRLEVDSAYDGIQKNAETSLEVASADSKYNITTSAAARYLVDGTEAAISGEAINVEEGGKSAVMVQNGGKLDISSSKIEKYGDSGSSVNTGGSGINSGIVVRNGSALSLDDVSLTTRGNYSNGITVFDNSNTVNINNSNIKISNYTDSRPLSVSDNSKISITDSTIESSGAGCEAVYSRGTDSSIKVSGSQIKASGEDTAAVSTCGDLFIDRSSIMSDSGAGINAVNDSYLEINDTVIASPKALISIEMGQSESSDYRMANSTRITNADLIAFGDGPIIDFTNINSDVYISGSRLSSEGNLFRCRRVSGRNGGKWGCNVSVTLDNQEGTGNIEAINAASMTLTLRNASYIKGAVNNQRTGVVNVILESPDDRLELTADSYVGIFKNHNDYGFNNIKDNGHNLYYDGSALENDWLENKTYNLINGGSLMPY